MPDRNRQHHGHFYSDQTGDFSVVTEEFSWGDTDDWQPEITIFLQEHDQLRMIRVVDARGNSYRLEGTPEA